MPHDGYDAKTTSADSSKPPRYATRPRPVTGPGAIHTTRLGRKEAQMPMFRKKPVEVEAMQLTETEESHAEVLFWMDRYGVTNEKGAMRIRPGGIVIPTLEGDMRASVGDWIIRGVNGEFYPCKPDIFAKTYDPA